MDQLRNQNSAARNLPRSPPPFAQVRVRDVAVPLDQRRLNLPDPPVSAQPKQPPIIRIAAQLITDGQPPGMTTSYLTEASSAVQRVRQRLLAEHGLPLFQRRR